MLFCADARMRTLNRRYRAQGPLDRRPGLSGGDAAAAAFWATSSISVPYAGREAPAPRRAAGARDRPSARPRPPAPDGLRPRDRRGPDGGARGARAAAARHRGRRPGAAPAAAGGARHDRGRLGRRSATLAFLLFETFALALDRLSPIKVRGLLEEHPERARILSGAGRGRDRADDDEGLRPGAAAGGPPDDGLGARGLRRPAARGSGAGFSSSRAGS